MASTPHDAVSLLTTFGPLDDALSSSVKQLGEIAKKNDGSPPFSDQTLLSLDRAGTADQQIVITLSTDQELIGAAVAVDGVMELVVHPQYRQLGHGSTLVTEMQRAFVEQPASIKFTDLNVWAHGKHEGATKLAARAGFQPVRELWKMSIPADTSFPEPEWADGVVVRTFEVGQDEQAWLNVNREAFATHPEQGKMTLADVQARQAEPWFKAEGFFLAEDEGSGELLGFHWTKLQPPVGEVYVVGVSPRAQGKGLGKSLTLAGLAYLQPHCEVIELYVDAENTPAASLYQQLGFTVATRDIMFTHTSARA